MADFPNTVFSPRTLANLNGIVFDASKTQNLYAEDVNNIVNEIKAIETLLEFWYDPDEEVLEINNLSVYGGCNIYDLEVLGSLYLENRGLKISSTYTPSSATAQGTKGTICWDTSYLYICTATNTWKRIALSSW